MKTILNEKPRVVRVVAADEIASIKRNGPGDIYGGQTSDGLWWAYRWSLDSWRKSREREELKP